MAIAMAAVRLGAYLEPGVITGQADLRTPTDATSSRPYLSPVGQFPMLSIKGHVNNFK